MSGTDFARSDLSPGLLCELVLKDEFTPRGALYS